MAGPAGHRLLSVVTLPIAIAVGLLIAILYSFHHKALNIALLIWIDLFRSFPVLVLLILIFYGGPFLGLKLPSFAACVLALTLNNSGYYGEIFRAGIESIPPGQREAARALGLHPLQIIFLVILPQAIARRDGAARLQFARAGEDHLDRGPRRPARAAALGARGAGADLQSHAAHRRGDHLLRPALAVRPLGGKARAQHDHEAEMKRLVGKTALITGASSGIGRAIAKKFHEEGAELLLMDITEQVVEGGEPTHKILNVPFFKGDVSKEADVEEAVRRAAAARNRLDIVVNDAAVRSGKKLTDTSLEEWNHVMAVNVTGVFLMCRAAVNRMLTQEIRNEARGRIVNISSQHGMISSPRTAPTACPSRRSST